VTFAETLQRVRLEAGLSQGGLALASGVPAATIKNLEIGRRAPLLETALKLAAALNVSLDVFKGCTFGPPRRSAAKRRGKS